MWSATFHTPPPPSGKESYFLHLEGTSASSPQKRPFFLPKLRLLTALVDGSEFYFGAVIQLFWFWL